LGGFGLADELDEREGVGLLTLMRMLEVEGRRLKVLKTSRADCDLRRGGGTRDEGGRVVEEEDEEEKEEGEGEEEKEEEDIFDFDQTTNELKERLHLMINRAKPRRLPREGSVKAQIL
jgi:hypothetical protein